MLEVNLYLWVLLAFRSCFPVCFRDLSLSGWVTGGSKMSVGGVSPLMMMLIRLWILSFTGLSLSSLSDRFVSDKGE